MDKMIRGKSKATVDESSSSKSESVIGRGGEEGIGSVPFTRGSNFEEGSSSSSHNHVNNNLKEHHRRRMLRYHRMMPHCQQTDPSSSSTNNTKKAPVYPPGSRFLPTDLGCARVHLRNKVEKNKSGFITTLDLYEDDPWLLDHVQNDLFPRGEWYYFTPRNKRGVSSCVRTVRGRGGGTWKSTTTKEPIKDKDDKVQGYKQSLVYNKTNVNGKIEPTGWNMTEYCLHQENQDDLVLCHIKGKLEQKGFAEEVKTNNILSNQVQEEEAGGNGVEMRTTLQEDHQQQQQQQEQDTPSVVSIPPPHDGRVLGVETTQDNDHNLLQEDHDDANPTQHQQQPQEQDASVLFIPPDECQDSSGYMMTMQNNFMKMLQINLGDATQQQQQQQQEQDAPPVLVPPPHEGQDPVLEEMIYDERNFMTMLDEDQQNNPDWIIDVDELLNGIVEDDVNEGHLQQQPVSQARHAAGGSSDQVTFTSY